MELLMLLEIRAMQGTCFSTALDKILYILYCSISTLTVPSHIYSSQMTVLFYQRLLQMHNPSIKIYNELFKRSVFFFTVLHGELNLNIEHVFFFILNLTYYVHPEHCT